MDEMRRGHENLIADLSKLLSDAMGGDFGDFTSNNPKPKHELVLRLNKISRNALTGEYDD